MWLSVEKEMWSFLHSFLVGSLERLGMWWIYPKLTNNSGEEKPPQFRLISHKLSRWALFAVSGGWGFGWGGMHTVFFYQVAVAQYSEEPRAAFHFNQHQDRNGALKAVKELHYAGGNTKTGVYVWVYTCWEALLGQDRGQRSGKVFECFEPVYLVRKLQSKVL